MGSKFYITQIVLATVALHNYIQTNQLDSNIYCPISFIDHEDNVGNIIRGRWRDEASENSVLQNNIRFGSNNATKYAFEMRDRLKGYFMNEGYITLQNKIK